MTNLPLDALIDDVAAQLTSGRPSPDLRARVLARIADEPARRHRLALTVATMSALAAVVLAAVTVVAARRVASFAPPTVSPASMRAIPLLAAGPLPVTRLVVPPPPRAGQTAAEAAPIVSAEEAAWMQRAIPALPTQPPIDLAGIQPDPLGTPLLELMPLATAPLAVAPIDHGGHVPPRRP